MHIAEKNTCLYTITAKILSATTICAQTTVCLITNAGHISGRSSCAACSGTSESRRYVRLALVGHLMKTMALSLVQSDSPNLTAPNGQLMFKYGTVSPHQIQQKKIKQKNKQQH